MVMSRYLLTCIEGACCIPPLVIFETSWSQEVGYGLHSAKFNQHHAISALLRLAPPSLHTYLPRLRMCYQRGVCLSILSEAYFRTCPYPHKAFSQALDSP